jgi:hypothetical protein
MISCSNGSLREVQTLGGSSCLSFTAKASTDWQEYHSTKKYCITIINGSRCIFLQNSCQRKNNFHWFKGL